MNLINYLVGFIPYKFACNLALRNPVFRACLVDCNDDYIGIGIAITRNARCCNVIIIPVQLFGNPIVIEP